MASPNRVNKKRRAKLAPPLSTRPIVGGGRAELPAYVSNGLIGLRVPELAIHGGVAILSGHSGEDPVERIEAASRIPYPIDSKLELNGVELSDALFCVQDIEQSYDFSVGELISKFSFAAAGVNARVQVLTFCSRRIPTLVCQQVEITTDRACEIVIGAGIDTRGADGRATRLLKDTGGTDGIIRWESAGEISTCGLAYTTDFDGAESKRSLSEREDQLTTHYEIRMRKGTRCRLRQLTSVVPSVLHKQPDLQAARIVAMAHEIDWELIQADNRAEWKEIWKGRIKIVGAESHLQEMADAAFFYLNTSVHPSSPASTSIFGLATWKNYHYYFGHVMWDIETFAIPVLTFFQPAAAAAMLEYRFLGCEAARRNARLVGRGGLQFPWESAPSTGEEAAPLPGSASWHEDHITLDVALAFAFFAEATGDARFLAERAWPVLRGVADWIETRVTKTERGFEILRSMGIAERKQPSNNTAFTNISAKMVLRSALQVANKLKMPAHDQWAAIADQLVIPERDGVIISHDGYRASEEKGPTPDPLMGIFPLWYEFPAEKERATLEFYLNQASDYLGSPMLSALYATWAAWAGDRGLAKLLMKEGYEKFTTGRFLQTLEYRTDRFPEQVMAGPFFANLCGFLMGLLLGLPAIQVHPGDVGEWPRRRVMLPREWQSIEIDRVWVRGREARLKASQGKYAKLEYV